VNGNAVRALMPDCASLGTDYTTKMYPAHFFGLYPPFPREDRVFVAMSFDHRFDQRWEEVIAPGIRNILRDNKPFLEPFRVDARKVSDSILTEILDGISRSRLVFADITTIGTSDKKPIRNANVMYEVGIAHAVRLAEEVLLFRSDDDALLFDTSNIRVNKYSPDDSPDDARRTVASATLEALREIDLRRHLTVQRVAESLNLTSLMVLAESQGDGGLKHPEMKTMGQVLGNSGRAAAIDRLLELGVIRAKYINVTPTILAKLGDSNDAELLKYESTEFGWAVFQAAVARLGLSSPGIQKVLEPMIADKKDEAGTK